MTVLMAIIVAAWLAWVTHPPMFTEIKGDGEALRALLANQRIRLIAWAVVVVAMVAGLVVLAVVR